MTGGLESAEPVEQNSGNKGVCSVRGHLLGDCCFPLCGLQIGRIDT